jgi:hypothetical protein
MTVRMKCIGTAGLSPSGEGPEFQERASTYECGSAWHLAAPRLRRRRYAKLDRQIGQQDLDSPLPWELS